LGRRTSGLQKNKQNNLLGGRDRSSPGRQAMPSKPTENEGTGNKKKRATSSGKRDPPFWGAFQKGNLDPRMNGVVRPSRASPREGLTRKVKISWQSREQNYFLNKEENYGGPTDDHQGVKRVSLRDLPKTRQKIKKS